ncbi:MAG: hypothetical protein KBC35_04020 [Candidatus Pacebacteria bacterium]|jgi:hypothetical protein|nr:hypothetical protein [Candidatus Paceibacterota bacterium]
MDNKKRIEEILQLVEAQTTPEQRVEFMKKVHELMVVVSSESEYLDNKYKPKN